MISDSFSNSEIQENVVRLLRFKGITEAEQRWTLKTYRVCVHDDIESNQSYATAAGLFFDGRYKRTNFSDTQTKCAEVLGMPFDKVICLVT